MPPLKEAPSPLRCCRGCAKEVLLSRVRSTMKMHNWLRRETSLAGDDNLAQALIHHLKPFNGGSAVLQVCSGSADSIIGPMLMQLSEGKKITLPEPCLCEGLTPRETQLLASFFGIAIAYPKSFWTGQLDELENNSPEVRAGLLAHFRDFLQAANHSRARFNPPAALLPILRM